MVWLRHWLRMQRRLHPADAATPDAAAPDPTNFLSWRHKNWDTVPFDQIQFPSDETMLKSRYQGILCCCCQFTEPLELNRNACNRLERAEWGAAFGEKLSRLATSSAQEARAGQRLRRARAKAAEQQPVISTHLPTESLAPLQLWEKQQQPPPRLRSPPATSE